MRRPGRFTPGQETRYPLYRRLEVPQGRFWIGAENLAPIDIRSPDRPARSSITIPTGLSRSTVHTNTALQVCVCVWNRPAKILKAIHQTPTAHDHHTNSVCLLIHKGTITTQPGQQRFWAPGCLNFTRWCLICLWVLGKCFTSPVWRTEFVASALGCYTILSTRVYNHVTQFQTVTACKLLAPELFFFILAHLYTRSE